MLSERKATQGSETSQYLEEKKSTEIPKVVASEIGYSPNRCVYTPGLQDRVSRVTNQEASRTVWKIRP